MDTSKLKSSEEISRLVNNVESSQRTANTLTDIWAQDELSCVMQKSKAFKGFFEILPMFPPTYRYIVGTLCYDLKYVLTMNNINTVYLIFNNLMILGDDLRGQIVSYTKLSTHRTKSV